MTQVMVIGDGWQPPTDNGQLTTDNVADYWRNIEGTSAGWDALECLTANLLKRRLHHQRTLQPTLVFGARDLDGAELKHVRANDVL